MPGTQVRDTLAPVLQNGTITATTTGSAVTVNRPGEIRVKLTCGTVSGTTPTCDVEIQASDSSTFASGNVSLGRFATVSTSTQTRYLDTYCSKTYMRAVSTVAGTTPSFGTLVINVNEPDYQRTRTTSA